MIERARELAHRAHAGQYRKLSGHPYIVHPESVFLKIETLGFGNEDMLCAALLHDVLEDCPQVTEAEILEATNQKTLKLVKELTNPSKGSKLSRADRKKMDRNHIKDISGSAKYIKLADRIDNLKDMAGMERPFLNLYAFESALLLYCLKGTYSPWESELELLIVASYTK